MNDFRPRGEVHTFGRMHETGGKRAIFASEYLGMWAMAWHDMAWRWMVDLQIYRFTEYEWCRMETKYGVPQIPYRSHILDGKEAEALTT